jgi:hypothetical protein
MEPEVSITNVTETGRFTLSKPSSTRRVTATGGLGRTFFGWPGSIPCAASSGAASATAGSAGRNPNRVSAVRWRSGVSRKARNASAASRCSGVTEGRSRIA